MSDPLRDYMRAAIRGDADFYTKLDAMSADDLDIVGRFIEAMGRLAGAGNMMMNALMDAKYGERTPPEVK